MTAATGISKGFRADEHASSNRDQNAVLLDLLFDGLRRPQARRHEAAARNAALRRLPAAAILQLLDSHGLAPVWLSAQGGQRALAAADFSPRLIHELEARRRRAIGERMIQQRALERAAAVLDRKQVSWLVFKGLHLAHTVYADPALRPAQDIDLLVAAPQRDAAIAYLREHGFELRPARETATHEINLGGHGSCIDLHWHLLRPGRSRFDLARFALATHRRLPNGLPVPGALAATVIQLIHPAVTEYVTARLIRVLDLARWLTRPAAAPGSWVQARQNAVYHLLDRAGLKTAAWTMLFWSRAWSREPIGADLLARLAPGALLQGYLKLWLQAGLPEPTQRCNLFPDPLTLYGHHPLVAQLGFSLLLNDTWRQRLQAVRGRAQELRKLRKTGFLWQIEKAATSGAR